MLRLADWPLAERQRITGVFTDIDDTLTTDGVITPDALQALCDLKAVGLHVISITGRPVGWSEAFAKTWPVDAIVAENGAVALRCQNGSAPLEKTYRQDAATRAVNLGRMNRIGQRILREIPGSVLAGDSAGRETDMAIDHSEFTHLSPTDIQRVVGLMQGEGMNATVSSIHINGWFGDHDKLVGARWAVRQLWQRDLDTEMDRWVYIGDSTNDQLMFQAFPHSVGVANIRRFEAQLSHLPRYITGGERGAGFTEVAAAVLQARQR